MNNESNKIREKIENSNISIEQKRIYNAITPIIFSDSDTVDLDKLVSTIESLLEKERREVELYKAIAFYALIVMTEIEQDGESIIPHLIDSDDNPGQALRTLLVESGESLKGSIYDFLLKGKQIEEGGYTDVEELIEQSKYRARLTPKEGEGK